MRAFDWIFGLGWLAFWGYWIAAAFTAKPGRGRWGQFAGFRVIAFVVIVALFRIRALRHVRTHSYAVAGVGLALWVLGLALALWARRHLGRNWGSPMTQKADPDLVTTGPYRYIRNPIYTGIILAGIGTAVGVSVSWLVAVAVIGSYFIYSAVMEQRYMTERFPDTYPAYRDRTKMLIPFVF